MDAGLGQPGDKLGKLEFGNVFWGENGDDSSSSGRGRTSRQSLGPCNIRFRPAGRSLTARTNTR